MKRTLLALAALSLATACSDSGGDVAQTTAATATTTAPSTTLEPAPSTTKSPTTTEATTAGSGDPLVNYTSPDGGFEASFLAAPTVSVEGEMHWTDVEVPGRGYFSVSYSDSPTAHADIAADLKTFAEGVLASYNAPPYLSQALEIDGLHAHLAAGTDATTSILVRVIQKGQRTYIVLAQTFLSSPDAADDGIFFMDHFHVTEAAS